MNEQRRHGLIRSALSAEIARQGAERAEELDIERLAIAVADAIDGKPQRTPIDPEGDGLTPRELNSSNDI